MIGTPKKNNVAMRLATCHPQRKHEAKGLCRPCYEKHLRDSNKQFHDRQLANRHKWGEQNPEKLKEVRDRDRRRNAKRSADPVYKVKRRDAMLRNVYGMTLSDYDLLLTKQNGGCAIYGRKPGTHSLHVDHDHKTGLVRGILCHQCNWYLGTIEANPEIIRKIIAYLKLSPGITLASSGEDHMYRCNRCGFRSTLYSTVRSHTCHGHGVVPASAISNDDTSHIISDVIDIAAGIGSSSSYSSSDSFSGGGGDFGGGGASGSFD